MNRPYFNHSIIALEADFDKHKNNVEILILIAEELKFRSTGRARKLLQVVNQFLEFSRFQHDKREDARNVESTRDSLNESNLNAFVSKNATGMPPPINNMPKDILSTWITLEVLSPQTFRNPKDLAGVFGSVVQLKNGFVPWNGEGEKSKPNYRLYYQIVIGTIDFEKAVADLQNIYVDKRVDRPSPKGEAILAVIVVDNKGRLTQQPAIGISSFAWGLPKALKNNLEELGDWNKVENDLTNELDLLLRKTDDDGNDLPLDFSTIELARNHIVRKFAIPIEYITQNRFAIRAYQYYTNSESPEPLLLNSFFLGDLITAKEDFSKNSIAENVKRYLGVLKPRERKDLLHDSLALDKAVSPSLIPAGRWPGPGRHSLVLLQQAAVNLAIEELKNGGILAVNGPPGTGKTTLLRDVVAALVTDRAEAMCKFENPATAFIDTGLKIKAGQASLRMYELDSTLKGFEMLIASSNNKAVENVSAELPSIKAIASDASDLRYFSTLSNKLLDRESWGLIAAVLGNMTNRSHFRQTFWWDKEVGFATYLAEAAGTPQMIDIKDEKTGQVIGQKKPDIVQNENPPTNQLDALQRWLIVKDQFVSILAKSKTKLSKLESLRNLIVSIPGLQKELKSAELELSHLKTDAKKVNNDFENAVNEYKLAEEVYKTEESNYKTHRKIKPNFFNCLFRSAAFRIWKEEHIEIAHKYHNAQTILAECDQQVKSKHKIVKDSEALLSHVETRYSKISDNFLQIVKQIEHAGPEFKHHIIDATLSSPPGKNHHLNAPWCDNQTQLIRDEVFSAAIKVHKAFIDAAAIPLKHNLGILMNIFSGRSLAEPEKMKLLGDLWCSLFLVVPSVSTTFASVERMLGKLSSESLGWLLIDEAGQALPQAAIGALMRTKKAIVVGDPIQIEPVVVLPDVLTKNICRRFGVDPDHYNAPEASVQTLADAATNYYAEFEELSGSRSVGVPLLVHRRCSDPMFSISNAIAYGNLMVQAKGQSDSAIKNHLGPSKWIEVEGRSNEKWCPEEGMVVLDLLRVLIKENVTLDLYIVTPFVIVADNLRSIIVESGILKSYTDNVMNWCYERVGTVHTVQGREAEAVIFVLGAPDPAQTGARSWAGQRPNLLNVAVTRAKEVLYVVGNRKLWQNAGFFKELSSRL